MNHQHSSSQNSGTPEDSEPQAYSRPQKTDEAAGQSPEWKASQHPGDGGRKRRTRHEERKTPIRTHSNPGRRSRGGGDFHLSPQVLIWGCSFLGAVVVFFGGYYLGQKSGRSAELRNRVVAQDAEFPMAESNALLDDAFKAYSQGKYRDAMVAFQKVQEKQPALVGIDYLVADSAYRAGEGVLASDAAKRAIFKNESSGQARALLALLELEKSKVSKSEDAAQQMNDPSVNAENEIKQLVASNLGGARGYLLWGEFLRSNGSYHSAADVLHEGWLRADPRDSREYLSAKEQLARLQNEPAKSAPSLSELTSMSGEQALVAALASLQLHQKEEAASFLERAKELYAPEVFQELTRDGAFADYKEDLQFKSYFGPTAN